MVHPMTRHVSLSGLHRQWPYGCGEVCPPEFQAVGRQLDVRGNSQALSVGVDLLGNADGRALGVMLSSGNASTTSTYELTGYYVRGKVRGEALGRVPHMAQCP